MLRQGVSVLTLALLGCSGGPPDLAAALEQLRAASGAPALAAAAVSGDRVLELAAVGSRRHDLVDPVGPDDSWHLGSNTKAMTATVLAGMCEEGLLRWDLTLAEALPEVAIHPEL